ncbi:MAG: ribonuclease HII [Candidatus Aminicenantes bacterium]|nr:MAG: ribonuclease HII [Candidatus Aminicenantes bacterium]
MCDYAVEQGLLNKNYRYICGVDEVGRGAIFGPVAAGAVILDPNQVPGYTVKGVKDSKKLSPKKRREVAEYVYKTALAFSIGWCWNDEIDEFNILEATKRAMKMAVKGLQILPDYVLMDGMEPDFLDIVGHGIVKGDNKSLSIAAASIIAKVFRDELLTSFARFFPGYWFSQNKGYPTRKHINTVILRGITQFHRKSFKIKGIGTWQINESQS